MNEDRLNGFLSLDQNRLKKLLNKSPKTFISFLSEIALNLERGVLHVKKSFKQKLKKYASFVCLLSSSAVSHLRKKKLLKSAGVPFLTLVQKLLNKGLIIQDSDENAGL